MSAKMTMETGEPIFKVYRRSGSISIYANGHVEGCEDLIGIANNIGDEISREALRRYSKPLESDFRKPDGPPFCRLEDVPNKE